LGSALFRPAYPEGDYQLEEDRADHVDKNIPHAGGSGRKEALVKLVETASGHG
jgi:hypothetical protein